ncbi:lysosome membrane protein 2a isoform X1 [Lepisosteus oculatus]|uniref:lysosome membrane protein 2a isoform X1 n=1 Tax=Lepisosteus oculatus TaxID=7918 RepID=UPI003719BD0B
MTRRSCAIYGTGIICAHLLIVGIALVVAQVFPTIIFNRLKKEITLTEGKDVFESWKDPPPPVYMQFFFFNVSNPDVFLKGGKPVVTQIGPYTYREYRPRENVTFVDNGTKVSALNPKSFVFLPEMSAGDPETDRLTTVNIPAVAVMDVVKSSFLLSSMVSLWMASIGVEMFMTRTVNEILWGFKDPLLSRLKPFKPEVEEYFGLMYKKNGSSEGEFVFHTGEEDYRDYGKIATWNGQSTMQWWSSNQSNMINGTDGGAFHPLISKNESLFIFAADLCRSIHVDFEKDVEVKGIPAYRFSPPLEVLASPEDNPANAGFCVPPGDCLGTGVLKVSVCRKGAPVVVSFPHFYQADQKYISAIEGMRPNKEDHETFLDINPTTGFPVRACKRAQMNILLKKVSGFPQTKYLNDTIFPVMFVNETVVIDDASAAKVRKLLLIVTVVSNIPLIIVGLGAIMLLVLIILICRARQKRNEVKRIDFSEAFPSFPTMAKEDTAYTQVRDKPEDGPENDSNPTQQLKNGPYISMHPIDPENC